MRLIIIVLISVFYGCSVGEKDKEATGRLNIKLSDTPFPLDLVSEANVTIHKVEIRSDNENADRRFIILSEEVKSYNLLNLTNGITAELVDLQIPVGIYDLIRLHVSHPSLVINNKSIHNEFKQRNTQTVINIPLYEKIEIDSQASSDLLLDFDVSRSFVLRSSLDFPGEIKGFNFTPVVKASNLSKSGSLFGEVTNKKLMFMEGALVSVYSGDTLNTTTFTAMDGSFAVLGLNPGIYLVVVEANGYQVTDEIAVEIKAATATTQNFKLSCHQ